VSMPKPRNTENRGLPARWQHVHGAFYYRVPPGLEPLWDGKRKFLLGKTLPTAYKVWAERLEATEKCATIGQLLDRYLLEVVPTKAPTTQSGNIIFIKRLRRVFGTASFAAIKPRHIYQYVDKREKKTSAHREIEVLSHAFTKAVEWGYIDKHPFKGEVRLEGEAPRTRYVEDWEVVECLALPASRTSRSVLVVRAYISIKLLTGMSRGDLLRLEPGRHIKEDGIHIQRHKTAKSSGKRTVYEWSDELRSAVDAALAARPVDISPYLFCTRKGECYINETTGEASGWKSLWQRFMARVLAETKVTEHFTEHDLRAKCASDAPTLERARALLSHADGRTTERIYRRKPERVQPLR
jgi:integrase